MPAFASGEQVVLPVYLEQVMQSALVQMWGKHAGEWSYAADSEIPSPAQIILSYRIAEELECTAAVAALQNAFMSSLRSCASMSDLTMAVASRDLNL